MPINFGLMRPIPQPKQGVVANIPVQPNQTDSTISGLISGLKSGQEISTSRTEQAATKQKMDQSAKLFPNVLQQSNNATEISNMDLAGKKQDVIDSATLRDAAGKGYQQYIE